jgi:PAS domain S-box-containing protein
VNDRQRALEDITILAETARDPFLVLDVNLKVIEGNRSFYEAFKVTKKETEGKQIYDLGNGQWNIAELKKLLGSILPQKKVFRDFEVEYNFPKIGKRIFTLNGQQLDTVQLIVLSFEDITAKKEIEKRAQQYTKNLEAEVAERTKELTDKVKDLEELTQVMVGRELKMSELKKEIARIKKLKKLNGNNGNNNTPI